MLNIYNGQHIQTPKVERRTTFKISKKETGEIFLEVERYVDAFKKKIV